MTTHFKLVLIGMLSFSCSGIIHASEISTTSPVTEEKTILHLPGNSTAPVKLSSKKINSLEDLENAQYAYIDKHYENYELIGGYTLKQDNAFIRCVLIKKDGKIIATEFDVTECFKKLKSKSKAIKKELDELEKQIGVIKTDKTGK